VIRGKDWSDFDPQDGKLTVAITRIQRLRAAKLTAEAVAADFLRRRIAPLQNKGRPAWDFKNAADVMRLYPGLNNNLTILQHTALCHRLFRADAKFKLAAGVIPLCNNSALSSIIAMMPVCNAHGPEGNLEEPGEVRVLEFFDNLSEKAIREEPILICPTTPEEVAYIASRAEEAMLAAEAGIFGSLEAEASEGVPSEEVLAGQGEAAGEQSGEAAGSSNEEDTAEEQLQEEPPAPGRKKRVLRKRVARAEPQRLCLGEYL
jgi:hypothetical protein